MVSMVGILTVGYGSGEQEYGEYEGRIFHIAKLAKSQRINEFGDEKCLKQRHF